MIFLIVFSSLIILRELFLFIIHITTVKTKYTLTKERLIAIGVAISLIIGNII